MSFTSFLAILGKGYLEILKAPFKDLTILWQLAPLILIWLLMEYYFETHTGEKLGWNSAVGNAISLFWICISMMNIIFLKDIFSWGKFFVILFMLLYAIFIGYISFRHSFSENITFALAHTFIIYYIAIFVVLWSFGSLSPSWYVILDIIILFSILSLIRYFIRKHFASNTSSGSSNAPF